jgi:hypothetical protein
MPGCIAVGRGSAPDAIAMTPMESEHPDFEWRRLECWY